MCGRYTFTQKPDPELVVQAEGQAVEIVARYNIAPTQLSLISPQSDPDHLYFYRWGLIPHWAKDSTMGHKMINARAETLWEKPAFREAAKYSRCIVWGDGFYEWKKEGRGKQPYLIGLENREVFGMAGISSTWKASDGSEILTYSIITTEPNELMRGIHDRMPVILPKAQRRVWLNKNESKENLQELLKPFDTNLMHAHPVSPSVGSVRNDHPGLIEPFLPPPTLFS